MAADYKSYIVNYDIKANVTDAASTFQRMARSVMTLKDSLTPVAGAMRDIAAAMTALTEQAKSFTFKPTIDPTAFQEGLKALEVEARATAKKIRQVLSTGVSGIAAQKQTQAQNKAAIAANTNVTPETIKAWQKAFGKNSKVKNLTVHIRGKADGANGALTIINKVKAGLEELQGLTNLTITPTINQAAFVSAEQQLKRLASLSAAITAPFVAQDGKRNNLKPGQKPKLTATEKQKLAEAQQRIGAWQQRMAGINDKIKEAQAKAVANPQAKMQGVITRNQNALRKVVEQYKNDPTVQEDLKTIGRLTAPVSKPKGKIPGISGTADIRGSLISINTAGKIFEVPIVGVISKIVPPQQALEIPANVQIAASQIESIINKMAKPILPVQVKLGWEKGVVGKQEQFKNLSKKIPPINLVLNTEAAIAKLEEFIALIKANNPQNINLTATGNASSGNKGGGTGSAQKPGNGKGTTGHAPYLGKGRDPRFDAYKQAYRPGIPLQFSNGRSSLNGGVGAYGTPARAAELLGMRRDAMAAFQNLTPWESKLLNEWLAAKDKVAADRTRNRQLKAQRLRNAGYNSMLPFASGANQAKLMLQNRWFFNRALENLGYSKADVPLLTNLGKFNVAKEAAAEMQRRKVAIPASLSKYLTDSEKQFAQQSEAIKKAEAAQKLQRKAANTYSRMAPIAQSNAQLKILSQYRRFFEWGAAKSGFNLTAGSNPFQNEAYMKQVATLMRQEGVMPPDQVMKAAGMYPVVTRGGSRVGGSTSARTPKAIPFDARARKWAYPFTGPTSFGVRTPMAVDMAKGMGVMFAIGGAMSAISNSFTQAMDYQNTMETTRAILKTGTSSYSADNFSNMERIVREVGIKTKFSAPEVASAAKFLAMAGFDIESINNAIRPIADLALIGDYDLGETADKMTNIMTTFGVTPEKLKAQPQIMRQMGNVMNAVATRSNTDVMMLAESAKYGGGVAKMYGADDPNIFADTMAIFGVMGNAGIQGSSAGTALRMMYQNIFNPNKKQAEILNNLQRNYGLKTKNADGSKRSMSDILMDMSNLIPKNEQADIISKLFRITAQPGANAAINAAANATSLGKLITEEGTNAEEVVKGYNTLLDNIDKNGLGALASLMLAARKSVYGDALGMNAEAKQNTIAGLWAQVTSTFTEGIVQAFEQRKGGFEGMLKDLRDWFAKPETITMLQHLLDLIIEIGKVMAMFVGLWAKLYSFAPGVIKVWVTTQMFFTQLGSLMMPLTAMITVFGKLRGVLGSVMGMSMLGGLGVGSGSALAAGGSSLGASAATGAAMAASSRPINVRAHSGAVWARAAQQYNTPMWKMGLNRMGRSYMSGAAMLIPSLAMSANGIKGIFFNLMTGLAKAVGLLVNPITLGIGVIAGLGFAINRFTKRIKGETDEQQRATNKAKKIADQSKFELQNQSRWYSDLIKGQVPGGNSPILVKTSQDFEAIKKVRAQREELKKRYATIFNGIENTTPEANRYVENEWRKTILDNPHYLWAIGENWNDTALFDPSKTNNRAQISKEGWQKYGKDTSLDKDIYNDLSWWESALYWLSHPIYKQGIRTQYGMAKELKQGMVTQALAIEGANSSETKSAMGKIFEIAAKYKFDLKNAEYQREINSIIATAANLGYNWSDASGWTPDYLQSHLDAIPNTLQYHRAIQNTLLQYANGGENSPLQALYAIQTIKNVQQYSEEWYDQLSIILTGQGATADILNTKTGEMKNVLVQARMKNGRLDFTSLFNQVKGNADGLIMTLQNFADFASNFYLLLGKLAGIDLSDEKAAKAFLSRQIFHKREDGNTYINITKETAGQYWDEYIATDEKSKWHRLAGGRERFQELMHNPIYGKGYNINFGKEGKVAVTQMRTTIGQDIINKSYENIKEQLDSTKQTITPTTATNPKPLAPDQGAYASNYERSAAKPTHVSINIGTLANFDKTTISASAEERDLMASIESKIANAVYQIFAEASNQAQIQYTT